jgi:sarcinarray family protein
MEDMRKFLMFLLFLALVTPVFSGFSLAYETPECDYGTFDAWYSKDGVEWQNTTVDHAELKCGEPFYIRATVSTKIDSAWISIDLWEVGIDSKKKSSFELLDGPCDLYKTLDLSKILEKNTSFTYTWKFRVKPDTDRVGGNAPLNIQAQFDKKVNDEWYSDDISFTAVNIYILDELWEGYTEDNDNSSGNNDTNDTPGFGLLFTLIAIAVFLTWKRKKE